MWTEAALAHLKVRNGFRMRGGEITRLEALMDGAVALAMTFLVIASNQVPGSFTALIEAFKQAPAFAASFAVLLLFWHSHVRWSRRYGIEDGLAVALTGFLIFTLLIFVYPLKIILGAFFAFLSNGWLPSSTQFESMRQLGEVFIAFGIGFFLLELTLWGLYRLALHRRIELGLSDLELFDTENDARAQLRSVYVAILATGLALVLPAHLVPSSSYVYFLLPIERHFSRRRVRRQRQLLVASAQHPMQQAIEPAPIS